ncbi:putative Dipeptidyl aminopeptidase B [Paratrimastix pyriformis]|uniref:Dipeptidyl aminopeptidase B n=1 Tax=Paratrimastix pyriformis TaxID=342808 RepID=A0ABQ8UI67_9EUKA|nr:putative Dipeptidyl aminopeptidase B [Paratrimastix pyriformis]
MSTPTPAPEQSPLLHQAEAGYSSDESRELAVKPIRKPFYLTFKFWAIMGLILAAIIAAAVLVVFFLRRIPDPRPTASLSDILSLVQNGAGQTWVPGMSNTYSYVVDSLLMIGNAQTGERKMWLNGTALAAAHGLAVPITWSHYSISAGGRYVLFATDDVAVYRHSFTAHFMVYDSQNDFVFSLSETESAGGLTKQQFAQWSPSASVPTVIFGRANDVYTVRITDAATVETRVTQDGSAVILNGIADWVHQEEIIETDTAVWWSPDGQKVAFGSFDQTAVPVCTLPQYAYDVTTAAMQTFRYPRPGDGLAVVSVRVFDGQSVFTVPLEEGFIYLTQLLWIDDHTFFVIQAPRNQESIAYVLWDMSTGTPVKSLRTDLSVGPSGWVHAPTSAIYLPAPHNAIVDIWPAPDEFDGVVYIPLADPTHPKFLPLSADVTALLGYRPDTQQLFYQIAHPTPMDREVYALPLEVGGKAGSPVPVLTGSLTATALLSPSAEWAIASVTTKDAPMNVTTFDLTKMKATSIIEDNADLSAKLSARQMPTAEFISFKPSYPDAASINIKRLLPPGFDSHRKYPVLSYVYGGPGSQQAKNAWAMDWPTYLASTFDVIVLYVDGRGTGARGRPWMHQVKNHLGVLEVEDQMAALKEAASWPFVDPDRLSIFGWSYGGYMTLRCLSSEWRNILRTGVAVAPVSDWRYYDAAYTERYMGTPQTNPDGYKISAVVEPERAFNLSTAPNFFLGYGTADDNVDPQNSLLVIRRQIDNAATNMISQGFPNDQHSINLPHSRAYIWKLATRFIMDNLDLVPSATAPADTPKPLSTTA